MADLTAAEITTLAKAAGIEIPEALLSEVGHSVNAVLEALDQIDVPNLDQVEPLPIILPSDLPSGSYDR